MYEHYFVWIQFPRVQIFSSGRIDSDAEEPHQSPCTLPMNVYSDYFAGIHGLEERIRGPAGENTSFGEKKRPFSFFQSPFDAVISSRNVYAKRFVINCEVMFACT